MKNQRARDREIAIRKNDLRSLAIAASIAFNLIELPRCGELFFQWLISAPAPATSKPL
jgi:hypothetical protein